MDEQISLFMDITSVSDPTVATNFLEMSGGDLSTAVGLYYEHGAGAGTSTSTTETDNNNNNSNNKEDDFEMANRLQNEIYAQQQNTENEIRQPIMPTHDTLLPQEYGFGGMGMGLGSHRQEGGMFGRTQRSVFNQVGDDGVVVLDSDSDENGENGDYDDEENEDDDFTGNYNLNNGTRSKPKLSNTQKRLAAIFRPPWDIISKLDLDSAKIKAREDHKWILINIQDVTDFRCQCLNRDFWSSQQIKELVIENFIFLQYHNDSPSGELYRNLYPFNDEYPHIAILDPMTGERMMSWNTNPEVHKFIEQVVDFLTRYSNDGTTVKISPSSTELNSNHSNNNKNISENNTTNNQHIQGKENNFTYIGSSDNDGDSFREKEEQEPKEITYEDKIKAIEPYDLPDPPPTVDSSQTTRIQIRSGIDGKRIVKKFNINDPILNIFKFVKFAFQDSLNNRAFTLKMQRVNLGDNLDNGKTIADCELKNASLLLEVLDEDDD